MRRVCFSICFVCLLFYQLAICRNLTHWRLLGPAPTSRCSYDFWCVLWKHLVKTGSVYPVVSAFPLPQCKGFPSPYGLLMGFVPASCLCSGKLSCYPLTSLRTPVLENQAFHWSEICSRHVPSLWPSLKSGQPSGVQMSPHLREGVCVLC